jgi:hypothetical protein
MAALAAGSCVSCSCSAHAPAYTARCIAIIIILIISVAITSSSNSMPAFAAAQQPPPALNPWLIMMEDTKTVFLLLNRFPDAFAFHPAAQAVAAAISLSSGLVSLKTRNSNLCTAAYGGYNGALPPPNIITDSFDLMITGTLLDCCGVALRMSLLAGATRSTPCAEQSVTIFHCRKAPSRPAARVLPSSSSALSLCSALASCRGAAMLHFGSSTATQRLPPAVIAAIR